MLEGGYDLDALSGCATALLGDARRRGRPDRAAEQRRSGRRRRRRGRVRLATSSTSDRPRRGALRPRSLRPAWSPPASLLCSPSWRRSPSGSRPPGTGCTSSAARCATCSSGRPTSTATATSPPTPARPRSRRCSRGWADAMWTQGERFGTIGARRDRPDGTTLAVEITTFRGRGATTTTRASRRSRSPTTIEADLARRDFTINAMALELRRRRRRARRPVRRRRRPRDRDAAHAAGARRSASATTRCGCCGRPASSPASGSSRSPELVAAVRRHGQPAGDRVGGADPRRARQADRRRPARPPGCGSWSTPGSPSTSCPSCRRCASSTTRSIATRTCSTHTIAVVENVDRGVAATFDFRLTRLAALFHDIGKPRTRWLPAGQGHDVPPPRRRSGRG